jgi:hypothetical protein
MLSNGFATFFDQSFYMAGGNNDGYSSLLNELITFNNQQIYTAGGANDGYSSVYSGNMNICFTELYASGGSGDGFNGLTYYGPMLFSPAWSGGNADGFSLIHSTELGISPAFFCIGGENDGSNSLHMPATYFGRGIWLGRISTNWNESLNWSMDYKPDLSVNVLIPAGRYHYPLIQSGNLAINNASGGYFCKSLTISQGGTLINKSNLYLYGDMTVSGIYQGDDNNRNDVIIYPGGNLKILAPGN